LKARYYNIKVAVGSPFESKVLTDYNCCWGLFESKEFYNTIAVGRPFESKVLTHCCWGPFESTVLTHYSFLKAPSMKFKCRVLAHFSCCWGPI